MKNIEHFKKPSSNLNTNCDHYNTFHANHVTKYVARQNQNK